MSESGNTTRLEAFSDGVFAIAITLLILEIRVPHDETAELGNRDLGRALLHLWPSFLAFVTSFFTILIMWVNHHGLFLLLRRAQHNVKLANGFLLMIVTFIPFPTALLARHLAHEGAEMAAVVYCASYMLVSVGYGLLLRAIERPENLRPHVTREHLRKIERAYWLGFATYLSATILAWFFPLLATLLCSVLWILWARLDYAPPGAAAES